MFSSSKKDSELLAGDYNAPGLSDGVTLKQGEFLHARWVAGEKRVDRYKLF